MKWTLKDPQMIGDGTNSTTKAVFKPDALPLKRDQDIELQLDFHFTNDFVRPEVLQIRYQEFSTIIRNTYEDYTVTIGELPQGLLNMQAASDSKIYIKVTLAKSIKAPESEDYKKSLNKKKNTFNKNYSDKTPPTAQQTQGVNKNTDTSTAPSSDKSKIAAPNRALSGGF
jgi:hypothetical protein